MARRHVTGQGKTWLGMDPVLLVCTSLLSLLSLVTLWGGREQFGLGCLWMQLGATVLGVACMVLLAHLDYHALTSKLFAAFYLISVVLLVLLLIRGTGAGTNKSWLYFSFLPFGIQPTELIKTALAISFAYHLSRVRGSINRPLVVLGLLLHVGVIIGLILLTGDLGVAVVFMGFVLLMLFCAGLSLWYFAGGAVLLAALLPIVWHSLESYQQQRLLVGFHPQSDPFGYGYQPLLSRDAMMAGKLFGAGVDGGAVYAELPAAHTDFMYATLCEKLGLLCGLLVLALLVVLIVRAVVIAARCGRDTGSFLCIGIAGCLILQTIENVGMCLALLPVVGITLPFISYGGSSVLGAYIMVGMLHSVNAHCSRASDRWK